MSHLLKFDRVWAVTVCTGCGVCVTHGLNACTHHLKHHHKDEVGSNARRHARVHFDGVGAGDRDPPHPTTLATPRIGGSGTCGARTGVPDVWMGHGERWSV